MLQLWLPLLGILVRCGHLVVWGLALLCLRVLPDPCLRMTGMVVLILVEMSIVVVVNLPVWVGLARGRPGAFVVRMV